MDKELISANCVELEDEVISESFICCVCLDLLYKPIVLACGHVSCFWCVHKSMNALGDSSCPICRRSYNQFPTICEMLHFLIVKMYPNAYHRRDGQMLEQEKKIDIFSPKFDISSLKSNSIGTEENNQISITDVLCPTCKKMLFRPAVLNCGHAFCETCVTIPEDEIIICSICGCPHSIDLPNVCLELNNFLEVTFPEDYVARKDYIERQHIDLRRKPHVASSMQTNSVQDLYGWLNEHDSKVHFGVGCDYCGVRPIVGTRYKCKDCKERIGFDLCEICYNTKSKLPGRFNQQHTAEHKFEVFKTAELQRKKVLRLVMGMHNYHGLVDLSAYASGEYETESGIMDIVVNPQENTGNNEDGSAESNEHLLG